MKIFWMTCVAGSQRLHAYPFFIFFDTKLAITNRQAEKRKTTELTEKSNGRYSVQSA